jgi:hypothetical protein
MQEGSAAGSGVLEDKLVQQFEQCEGKHWLCCMAASPCWVVAKSSRAASAGDEAARAAVEQLMVFALQISSTPPGLPAAVVPCPSQHPAAAAVFH